MVLDTPLLNTQHYKLRIKGKVEQSREKSGAPLTPWCSSYLKGSLRVTLNYGHQLYLFTLYLIIWHYGSSREETDLSCSKYLSPEEIITVYQFGKHLFP